MTNTIPKQAIETVGKTAELLLKIRQTPLFRQLIPQEAGIGFPIPLRKEGKVYAILPCFGFTPSAQKGQTAIFPPFATITVNWANQVPVEYVNFSFRNPAPELQWSGQIGTFPHPAVANMTVEQYKEKRHQLLAMYDEMFAALEQNNSFSSEWIDEFSELLSTLLEPALKPYYRVLGTKFCARFLAIN
ncbi:MAG: hypothetical protein ACSI46_13715 [Gloeotrichia echinulata DVL01]|jgi:hypothetical protein